MYHELRKRGHWRSLIIAGGQTLVRRHTRDASSWSVKSNRQGGQMKLRVVVLALILGVASIQPVNAIENPRDLLKFCQKLEQGRKGAGEDIRIPNTRESLLCWGYMQAIQD